MTHGVLSRTTTATDRRAGTVTSLLPPPKTGVGSISLLFLVRRLAAVLLILAIINELPRERSVDVGDEGLGVLQHVGIEWEETVQQERFCLGGAHTAHHWEVDPADGMFRTKVR